MIEVKGIGFPNKGAELLLNATLKELSHENNFCTEPYSPYSYKVKYPLYTKLRISKYKINLLFPFLILPNYITSRFGLIKPSQVNLILDASGYAYGGPWEKSLANDRLLDDKSTENKVVLPQSLGPFDSNESKLVAKKLSKQCQLIYAREPEGAEHFKRVTGRKVPIVPDITFLLDPVEIKRDFDVIIIPNFQVLKREGKQYIELLKESCEQLVKAGRTITLLNHEGEKDKEICHDVIDSINSSGVDYYEAKTGMEAKSIINKSNFVITSRYHGLISALSTSTPCIAIGWSFKYDSAMELFDINVPSKFDNAEKIVSYVLDNNYCDNFDSKSYSEKLNEVKSRVNSMWNEIKTTYDLI